MLTYDELIKSSSDMLAYWEKSIENNKLQLAPYQKEYDLVYAKWSRIDNEIEKCRDLQKGGDGSYTTAAKKLKNSEDCSRKIKQMTQQADTFLPEINRLRSCIEPIKLSIEKSHANIKELQSIIDMSVDGLNWELEYSKNMETYYTIGRPTFY